MSTQLASFASGILVGVVFSLLKLPVPAPPNLAGILGIVGIFVGYVLTQSLWPR